MHLTMKAAACGQRKRPLLTQPLLSGASAKVGAWEVHEFPCGWRMRQKLSFVMFYCEDRHRQLHRVTCNLRSWGVVGAVGGDICTPLSLLQYLYSGFSRFANYAI